MNKFLSILAFAGVLLLPASSVLGQITNGSAETITADIQELARGLSNDPLRIYNFVHDHIQFVPYFGSQKGADLTLITHSGNDFDQCALLTALLRAAGYSPVYQFGFLEMPYASTTGGSNDLEHWLQLTQVNTNWSQTSYFVSAYLGYRGYPADGFFITSDTNTLVFQRLWVALTTGGNTYYLDPAFKTSQPVAGTNLASAMGLSTNSLMTAAGGTDTATYTQNLNETNVANTLTGYATNLLAALRASYPNANVAQVVGGQTITPSAATALPTSMAFTIVTNFSAWGSAVFAANVPVLTWTNIPTNMMATLTFAVSGTNYYWATPQLGGQRLSLTFSSAGLAQLWQDDVLLLQTNVAGGSGSVAGTPTVNFPYGYWDSTNNVLVTNNPVGFGYTMSFQSTNANYAITYGSDEDGNWLVQRQAKLAAYRSGGLADTSRQVLTETLNVFSHEYTSQTEASDRIIRMQTAQLPHFLFNLGRAGQETNSGYYVDVFGKSSAFANNYGDWQSGRTIAADEVSAYFGSGMEHATIEASQATNFSAASTVNMLEVANTNGYKVYKANSGNWSTVSTAVTGYAAASLNQIDSAYISSGGAALLPGDGSLYLTGTSGYQGYGYVGTIPVTFGVDVGMIIGGLYNGGYAPYKTFTVNAGWTYTSGANAPQLFVPSPPGTGANAGDPVDMADTSFTSVGTDLSLGGVEPRGIYFGRIYDSNRRFYNLCGMANGWVHNYFLSLTVDNGFQSSLGATTPQQMVPILVATCAAANLFQTNGTPKNWLLTSLIAKWGVDQTIKSAVNVTLGRDSFQFIREPDGSFAPPAGSTMTLIQTNSQYQLSERHGRTYVFGANNVVTNIFDQFGNNLYISYNSSNWVSTVTDWKGRMLTFNYSGTPSQLTSVADSTGRSVSYSYATNAYGQWDLTSVMDADSFTNRFLYDTNHEIVATLNAAGQTVTSNIYDGFGRVTTQYSMGNTNDAWQIFWSGWENVEQDPLGAQRTFFFDDLSRLVGEQDTLSNTSQVFYDGQNHVTMTVSPLNETNLYFFDGNNNLIMTVDPLSSTNTLYYDSANNLIKIVDPRGHADSFGYSSGFEVTGATNGAGDWATFGYRSDGLRNRRTDAGGNTAYAYDSYGQVDEIIWPNSLAYIYFTNNSLGDVISTLNGDGFVTQFGYDARRSLTNVAGPTNLAVGLGYDAVGNLGTTTDARGFMTTNIWSPTRRLLATLFPTTPQGAPTVTNTYDARDWLSSRINPVQQATLFTNDAAHRLISVTDPLSRTTGFGYDGDGRPLTATDPAGETIFTQWSARSQMLVFTDAATNIIGRVFDGAGNQITLTNRDTNVWKFQFDGANRLTNATSPMTNVTAHFWNNRGLPSSVIQPSGHTTSLSYDNADRLSFRTDPVGTTGFTYDADNNLTNVTENSVSYPRTYDAYNRLVKYVDGSGNIFQYRYDANNNLTNLIYPGGNYVYYLYDALNRLTNVVDWAGRKTSYTYDLAGHMTNMARPNGTVRAVTYDAAGQTSSILEKTSAGNGIAYFQYTNDLSGRIQSEFIAPYPHAYSLASRSMTFDKDDRLATVGGTSVTMDVDGNMTYGPGTNSTFGTYTYDARNRLLSGGGLSYAYDPAGNRTWMTNGATATQFIVNPNGALAQTLIRVESGATNYYVYGLGLIYHVDTAGNTYSYHYDSRGSTVAITSSAGSVTDRIEYSPYGTITYRSGTTDTPFLFNGRYGVTTGPNGLLFMRARYYNPYLCRFVNADPSGFGGGLNMFAFANGNPVSLIDPFGLGAVGEPSTWSLFWSSVSRNGLSDVTQFFKGAAQTAGNLALSGLNMSVNPGETIYNAVAGLGTSAGQLEGDPGGTLNTVGNNIINSLETAQGIGGATVFTAGFVATAGLGAEAEAGTALESVMAAEGGGSQALVQMAPELYANGEGRTVAGYYLYGNSGLVGSTYNVNVFQLSALEGQAQGLGALSDALQAEAQAAGASQISITGNAVVNGQLANPAIAARAASMNGFMYQQVNPGQFILTAPIKAP